MDWAGLVGHAAALGYELEDRQLRALRHLHRRLAAATRTHALTRLVSEAEFLERHVLDALAVAAALADEPPPPTLVDVGSGAGFPALPLAVALPAHLRWRAAAAGAPACLAIEPVAKKAAFIAAMAAELELLGFRVLAGRAETAGHDPSLRERFALATCRALAELAVLLELCLPLLEPGGLLIAWKGPRLPAELARAGPALELLGGRLERVVAAPLPGRALQLVKVRKVAPTPARFPRRDGVPRRRPLGVRPE